MSLSRRVVFAELALSGVPLAAAALATNSAPTFVSIAVVSAPPSSAIPPLRDSYLRRWHEMEKGDRGEREDERDREREIESEREREREKGETINTRLVHVRL